MMKKIYVLIVMMIGVYTYTNAQSYSGGSGTASDPFLIADKSDLLYLSTNTGQDNYHFKQVADIVFDSTDFASGGDFYNGGNGFSAIDWIKETYDGNHHRIENLTIFNSPSSNAALFRRVDGTVKNLALINANINCNGNSVAYVGGLVGYLYGGTLNNCHVSGTVAANDCNQTGGMVGYATNNVTITNCKTDVEVSSNRYNVGGLVGDLRDATVTQCSSTGKVNLNGTLNGNAGGLVGSVGGFSAAIITDCYSTAEVFASNQYASVGGFIGRTGFNEIHTSFAAGDVQATGSSSYIGGFIGWTDNTQIYNSYSRGDADGGNNNLAGGFIGRADNTPITNCYSTGNPFASGTSANIGGLVASNSTSTITNSFWDVDSSFTSTSDGGTGKTVGQMKVDTTFTDAGWDFVGETTNGTNDYWKMDEVCYVNDEYPILSWQNLQFDSVQSAVRCGPGPVTLSASYSFGEIKWYDQSTGGNALDSIFTYTTLSLSDTTSYWVSLNYDGCESAPRQEVVAAVDPSPDAPTGDTTQVSCDTAIVADLAANGQNLQWYDADSVGNLLSTSTTLVDSQTYYASQTISGCESMSRLAVTYYLVPITDQPVSASPSTICKGDSTAIVLGNSQPYYNYVLRLDSNNAIVDGTVAGTDSMITFNTGSIDSTTSYNVFASEYDFTSNDTMQSAQVLDFDGVDDYVEIANESAFDFTTNMTVEFWIKSPGFDQWDGMVTKGDDSWRVHANSTGEVNFAGNGAFSAINSTTQINDGQWHHVAATYDGANARLYIDGIEENSSAGAGSIDNSTFAVAFGENLQATGRWLDGKMDQVRIWNVARTGTEIANNIDSCLSGAEPGLVALYDMEEDTGSTTLNDKTSNGNDGTLTNMDPATDWVGDIGPVNCLGCVLEMSQSVTVTVNQSTTGSETITTCDSYTVPSGDETHSTDGTYMDTIPNASGCDSVITINLTINNSTTGTDAITACDSYTWIDGNTYTSDNNTATDTLNTSLGCDSVVTLDLTIDTVDVTITNNSPTLIANASGATYQWIDCDNGDSVITGETDSSFTATSNGNYAVVVTENGCTDTSSCIVVTNIGVFGNHSDNDFRVYPNPTDGQITVLFEGEASNGHLFIMDVTGRKVFDAEVNGKTMQISLDHINQGTYHLMLINENGRTIQPIVIQ